ncbi:MAG: DUF2791 family P-loop domain-containing protein [Oscillospiraceae bacterium]|nr:DUF2791 family P-loop domain-containing protein [Oscillospiraceae bacterium]
MATETERAQGLNQLQRGGVPAGELLQEVTAGLTPLTDFWDRQYLDYYIPMGGSKIKFITGHPGSGKTHFAAWTRTRSEQRGYRTVSFSAKDVWLHDFREIYLAVIRQMDLEAMLKGCAERVVREMGYDPGEIPAGKQFMDLLAERHENDAMTRKTLRDTLRTMFSRNPLLDNTFAQACSLLTGGILGYPVLEKSNREVLMAWLEGDRTLTPAQLRLAGLTPMKVTKYNARHLLRSLCETIHMSGAPGLVVVIDDLETLLNRGSGETMRYTKLRRDDTYESIRQLIDDIDSMRYVLFLLCFDREMLENENAGMKSYQALWLRIQNEVVSTRFNCFADIVDMDRYGDEMYTPELLAEMSAKLCAVMRENGAEALPLTPEQTEPLRERAAYGQLGLPYMVNRLTLEGGRNDG